MGPFVLQVESLKKSYQRGFPRKTVNALKGISFRIKPGTITGFLGANGAGKTTTIKCLLGLAHADSGSISYFGKPGLSVEAKGRIGFLPERPYFYEYLTGYEFLRFYGDLSLKLSSADLKTKIVRLLKRVGLAHAGDRQLRGYSKGMLQRIGIAQALIHDPEFIILDEPMTGLDPDGRLEVAEIIQETAKSGTAVFFSSHLLPDAERLCDHLVILKSGELVYDGATTELLSRVEAGYRLRYTASGNGAPLSELAPSLAELQSKIDEVRRVGGHILEVRSERLTLEEAFIRIAFDKETA